MSAAVGQTTRISPGGQRAHSAMIGSQKEKRAPSWTFRGTLPCPVILPKSGLLRVVFGTPKTTRLSALEADARISRFVPSEILKSFNIAISSFTVHGVRKFDIWRGVSP